MSEVSHAHGLGPGKSWVTQRLNGTCHGVCASWRRSGATCTDDVHQQGIGQVLGIVAVQFVAGPRGQAEHNAFGTRMMLKDREPLLPIGP